MTTRLKTSVDTGNERLHGLDALRGFALLLGIVLHASMSFLPGAQYFWLTSDNAPAAGISPLFYVPHMFRMLLFFVLAGFFGRVLHERLGTRAFLIDRWRRVGKPLLVFWAPTLMAITAVLVWGAWLANGGKLPQETPPGPSFRPDDFPLTHLWFLYELMLCYGALLVLRALVHRIVQTDRWRKLVALLLTVGTHPLGCSLLALPLVLALLNLSNWYAWFGIPTPDRSLYPNLPVFASYWLGFAIGWCLHGHQTLLGTIAQRWLWHVGAAIALTVYCLNQQGIAPNLQPATTDAAGIVYAVAYAVAAWQWCWGLTGAALRFWSSYSPFRRYLADASYWLYIAHLPVVLAMQTALRDWSVSPWLKLLIVISATVFGLLLSYSLFVRQSFVGVLLNGRRQPRWAVSG